MLLKRLIPELYWPKSVDLDGVKVPVRGMPLNFGTKYWLKNGQYEQDERRLLDQVLMPGMNVLEMGGSIGVLAQIICQKVGPTGRVISVEASDRLLAIASEMWPKLDRLERIAGFAFPVENGDNIYVNDFQSDGSELDGRGIWEIRGSKEGNAWDLRAIRLKFDFVPDVLVVDIEGGENVLATVPPNFPESLQYVLMEFHPHVYGLAGQALLEEKIIQSGFEALSKAGQCTLFKRAKTILAHNTLS
jgi:hypothetical protein